MIEDLQKLHTQLQAEHQLTQQGWTDIRAGHQQFLDDHADLREIREGFRQITAEFSGIKGDVERERNDLHKLYAAVESQLSRMTTMTTALTEALAQPKNDSQIADIIEYTKQHQAEWLQQRAGPGSRAGCHAPPRGRTGRGPQQPETPCRPAAGGIRR